MTIRRIVEAIERLAPPGFQSEYDNAGLQAGLLDRELTGVLLCLDITEAIVDEALERGCNLVVSHHPLLYRPLRRVSDETYQQRTVMKAILFGVTLYSAHTNLDKADGGVNDKIASLIGFEVSGRLTEERSADGTVHGFGAIGDLPVPEKGEDFIARLKDIFDVRCVMHTDVAGKMIRRVAVCGGSGSSLLEEARAGGADCYVTGELNYHAFFDAGDMTLVALGHYQSEQYTKDLLRDYLAGQFPGIRLEMTSLDTNPIKYTC